MMNVIFLANNGVSSVAFGCALVEAAYRCFFFGAILTHLLAVPVLVLLARLVLGRRLRLRRAYLLSLIATACVLTPDLLPTNTWWHSGFWWRSVSTGVGPLLTAAWGFVFVAAVCVFGVRKTDGKCMGFWQTVFMSVPLTLFIGVFPAMFVWAVFKS